MMKMVKMMMVMLMIIMVRWWWSNSHLEVLVNPKKNNFNSHFNFWVVAVLILYYKGSRQKPGHFRVRLADFSAVFFLISPWYLS